MRESRQATRREAKAASTLRSDGSRAIDVTVLDLSETGVRIMASVPLDIGQQISIGLAGVGARHACVAWAGGGEYGCAFAEPLKVEEAQTAFSTASVVSIGFGPVPKPPSTPDRSSALDDLYARHRTWVVPLDAMLFALAFVMLLGLACWKIG